MKKREKKFSKQFDLSHSIMFIEFPVEYTETICVPGIFVKKINNRVHLKDGTCGEMDSAFILDPDNEILRERVEACLEHQSKPVSSSKLRKFGDYDIQLVCDENLPTLLIVASHLNLSGLQKPENYCTKMLNDEKSKNILIRSPSDITQHISSTLERKTLSKD